MELKTVLLVSIALRVALIAWGEVQDRLLDVKYTDIDYSVFTDAARFVAQGQSPFLRSTYRYSPLLAYILLPNVWLTRVWGKVLFAAADIVVAWQLWRLGQLQGTSKSRCMWSMLLWLYNPFTVTISTRGSCDSLVTVMLLATLLMLLQGRVVLPALLYGLAVHFRIFPIVYAPAIVLFLAHRQLQQRQQQQIQRRQQQGRPEGGTEDSRSTQSTPHASTAGSSSSTPPLGSRAHAWVSAVLRQGCVFGGISGGTFLLLGLAFYALYGHEFLHGAYLHHTVRKDPKHNFSVYYYPIYLDFMPWPAQQQPPAAAAAAAAAARAASGDIAVTHGSHLIQRLSAALPHLDVDRLAAVPQLALLLVVAVSLHRDLPLCLLMQTWAFVAFNKVSTAQYFVWYLSLLPAALQKVPWPLPLRLRAAAAAWVVTQLHWLLWGYLLEFEGRGVHLGLWTAGVLFLAANAFCMVALMEACGSKLQPGPTKADRAKLRHGAVTEH